MNNPFIPCVVGTAQETMTVERTPSAVRNVGRILAIWPQKSQAQGSRNDVNCRLFRGIV